MDKLQKVDPGAQRRRQLTALVATGALPIAAAIVVTGTAAADPVPAQNPEPVVAESQYGAGAAPQLPSLADLIQGLLVQPVAIPAATADEQPGPAGPAATAPPALVDRNSSNGTRAVPGPAPLAPVDFGRLHLPDPATAGPVAPIQAPEGTLRFGDLLLGIPGWMSPEQAAGINAGAAETEAGFARTLDSAGFEPTRSDRIAASTIGSTLVGAGVGALVVSPLAVVVGVVGGVIGTLATLPFAPASLVWGPVLGATAAMSLIVLPAATVGAAVGAVAGMTSGVLAPPVDSPAPATP